MYDWIITYQMHTKDECFGVSDYFTHADSIGEALEEVDEWLSQMFEEQDWSDYHLTSICIVPELH